jgi:AraC-like DNA-binding protein
LSVAPETLVDALGDTWPTRAALRPSTQIKVRLLAARLSPGRLPPVARVLEAPGTGSRRQGRCKGADGALLGAEDEALCLLDAVARDFTDAPPPRLGWAQRHRVEQVRELLATRPTDPWRLGDIADVVGCSPFHLARQFRAVTGESISRHLLLLRLALALDRIVGGERNLGQLATELGFASHSHLTSRFRRMFGTTPQRLRTIVTAPPDEHA